jgi:hypothetical protein
MLEPRAFIWWTGSDADDWTFPNPVGFIWKELKDGRLRQGWAPPGASLVENGAKVPQREWERRYVAGARNVWKLDASHPLLDPPKKVTTRYQILSRMLRMAKGDVIVVPRMPSRGEFTCVRVAGGYRFDDGHYESVHPDLGHVVPIDPKTLVTYGYGHSNATRQISGTFQNYRSAISPVRKPELRRLIVELATESAPS